MCEQENSVLKKKCAHDGSLVLFFGQVWESGWVLSRSEFGWTLVDLTGLVCVWVASGNTPCFAWWCKNGSLDVSLVNMMSPKIDGVGVREIIVRGVFVGEVNRDGEEIECLVGVRAL